MIIAGTVSAYLTLSIDQFKNNLTAAMQLLGQLGGAGQQSSSGIAMIESAAARAAGAVSGQLAPALGTAGAGLAAAAQQAGSFTAAVGQMSGSVSVSAGTIAFSMNTAALTAQTACAGAAGAMTAASTAAAASSAGISSAMQAAGAGTVAGMSAAVAGIASFAAAQPMAVSVANGIRTGVENPIKALSGSLRTAMVNAGSGMASGLSSKAGAVVAAAKRIADSVRSTIESALQIASPSKVMRRVGAYTVEGMALGMEDLIPRVASAAGMAARAAEEHAAASIGVSSVLPRADVTGGAYPSRSAGGSAQTQSELAALGERMDRLLDYLAGTEQVLRLDGRSVGRMIREYTG